MQQMLDKDQASPISQEPLYYPPTKPRQTHYPTTIQVTRRGQRDIGEWFRKCIQGISVDKRYGFLLGILLLFFCLGAVFAGGNASLSTQVSAKKLFSVITPTVQAARPPHNTLTVTATVGPAGGATSTHSTLTSLPASTSPMPSPQLFITFTAAYTTNRGTGVVSVHTLPGAMLTISVTYRGGRPANNKALQGPFYADGGGNYVWMWEPKEGTGLATATVTVRAYGQTVSESRVFSAQLGGSIRPANISGTLPTD